MRQIIYPNEFVKTIEKRWAAQLARARRVQSTNRTTGEMRNSEPPSIGSLTQIVHLMPLTAAPGVDHAQSPTACEPSPMPATASIAPGDSGALVS
jgi:hypothetical protein